MRKKNEAQTIKRLEAKVAKLEKDKQKLTVEMIERGKEITKMIRIFLVCENLLPDGQKEEFRSVALEYAARCDKTRGSSYCKSKIDFGEGRPRPGDYGSIWGPE